MSLVQGECRFRRLRPGRINCAWQEDSVVQLCYRIQAEQEVIEYSRGAKEFKAEAMQAGG